MKNEEKKPEEEKKTPLRGKARVKEALESQVAARKEAEKKRQEEQKRRDEIVDEKFKFKDEKECRGGYQEIVNGYSFSKPLNCYVKHFTDQDISELDVQYLETVEEARDKGLLSEEDKLELLAKTGHWSDEDELAYQQTLASLTGLLEQKSKLIFKAQLEQIQDVISKYQTEHKKSLQDRQELVGITAESYVSKQISESYIYKALFRDEELKKPLFSKRDFAELDEIQVGEYTQHYNNILSRFSEKNFKRIGVQWFFMNNFACCEDNPYVFYGQPVTKLSLYQIALFSKGKYYKFITGEKNTPPADLNLANGGIDIEKYVKWYDIKYSEILRDRDKQIRDAKKGSSGGKRGPTRRRR